MSGPPVTGHHHFVQHFLRGGDYIETEFTCTAPFGAFCRQSCDRCTSEEQCICASRDDNIPPDLQDQGECLVLLWLRDDPEDSFNGERQPIRGPGPQPITVDWMGDYCEWHYA